MVNTIMGGGRANGGSVTVTLCLDAACTKCPQTHTAPAGQCTPLPPNNYFEAALDGSIAIAAPMMPAGMGGPNNNNNNMPSTGYEVPPPIAGVAATPFDGTFPSTTLPGGSAGPASSTTTRNRCWFDQ